MTFEEYYPLALRTANDLQSKILNSIHATLGMGSEIEELLEAIHKGDSVNIGEEITDIVWYIALYKHTHNIDFNFKSCVPSENCIHDIILYISRLQDLDKKELAYGKVTLDEVRVRYISNLISFIYQLYDFNDLDYKVCFRNNINKLIIRYPNKFSESEAITRNLLAERKELEKS